MIKTYVRASELPVSSNNYLTKDKLYEVLPHGVTEDELLFKVVNDQGQINYCCFKNCAHLDWCDWEVVTVGCAHELNLKLGDVVALVKEIGDSKKYTVVSKEQYPEVSGRGDMWLQGESEMSWMPIVGSKWTYEVIHREETQEWSGWKLSPKGGTLKTIKGEPLENFEVDARVLAEGEPQFAYRYKAKEPEPTLEVDKVYYSVNGNKWECIATRGNTAFLSGVWGEGYEAAYKFELDGTPICLADYSNYTIDFTKGSNTDDSPQ